jgi:hypothetical protein
MVDLPGKHLIHPQDSYCLNDSRDHATEFLTLQQMLARRSLAARRAIARLLKNRLKRKMLAASTTRSPLP